MNDAPPHRGFQGPRCWAVSTVTGLAAGALLAWLIPGSYHDGVPAVPAWLVAPFALLLLCIATMPFLSARFWHDHFPDFAFLLGALIVAYYLVGFRAPAGDGHRLPAGASQVLHAAGEYFAFMALVGGLYVVSGTVLVDVRARATPAANTALLALGALLANLVGTTGASMLLIRPYMRNNRGRLRPIHVVLFIFIVSNCGGCLTPIGDPPLYLGFLSGVPFFWTLEHLWPDWLLVNGCLLAASYAIDRWYVRDIPARPAVGRDASDPPAGPTIRIRGTVGLICLALMLVGVFFDPLLSAWGYPPTFPFGATLQVLVAITAWGYAPRDILAANEFSFFPVKEVGLLFLGIFATMVPALGYLSLHGPELGISSPTSFYFGAGGLSAVLDNAPTYMNFLQIAVADPTISPSAPHDTAITPESVRRLLYMRPGTDNPLSAAVVHAISTAAVFFGAMTYIGNGPNFMVRAVAQDAGVRMPGFFGYFLVACVILLPILVLNWAVFVP